MPKDTIMISIFITLFTSLAFLFIWHRNQGARKKNSSSFAFNIIERFVSFLMS